MFRIARETYARWCEKLTKHRHEIAEAQRMRYDPTGRLAVCRKIKTSFVHIEFKGYYQIHLSVCRLVAGRSHRCPECYVRRTKMSGSCRARCSGQVDQDILVPMHICLFVITCITIFESGYLFDRDWIRHAIAFCDSRPTLCGSPNECAATCEKHNCFFCAVCVFFFFVFVAPEINRM